MRSSNHSQKKWKDSLETQAKPTALCVYVENQAIVEAILLYRASKCKQTKEQRSEDCLWTHIFTFLRDYYTFFFPFFLPKYKYNRIKLCYNTLQFVKETQFSTILNIDGEPNYVNYKILLWYMLGANCKKTWGITSKYYRAS